MTPSSACLRSTNWLRSRAARRALAVLTAGVIATTAVAACSSSKSSGSASAPSTAQSASSFGPTQAAAGSPYVLGSINQEGSAAGSFPELREAQIAAIDYLNTYKGGLHGRPLKLDSCISNGDAAKSASCATELSASNPLAILGGIDLGSTGSVPIFQKANLAYIGGIPLNGVEFTAPNSVQFIPQVEGLMSGAAVYLVQKLHIKSLSMIYYPVASSQLQLSATTQTLKALGVTKVTPVQVSVTATDSTPGMAAAAGSSPDVIAVTEAGPTCVSDMQAHAQLSPGSKLVTTAACVDPAMLKAAGSAAEGMLLPGDYEPTTDTADPDVALFLAAMAKWAPGAALNENSQAGFSSVMNFWTKMNALPASDLTTAGILKAFHTGTNNPNFMAHPYTCDTPLAQAPALCNTYIRMIEIKDGKPELVDNGWYSAAQYTSHN